MDISNALISLEQGQNERYPIASEADCLATEASIGARLPESYRTFVKTFSNGAYLYGIQEVSAVGSGNRQVSPIQRLVEDLRESVPEGPVPYRDGGEAYVRQLIPYSLDSNGNSWCFVLEEGRSEEAPVVYWDMNNMKLYSKLASFADWLETLIREQTEVIRAVCSEDIIYDEMGLG